MTERIELIDDPASFARRALPFCEAELERQIVARITRQVLAGRYPGAHCAAIAGDHGELAAVALRTPGFNLMCTRLPEPAVELGAELLEAWLAVDPEPPGVNGVPPTARAVADAWVQRTGGGAPLQTSMAMHALTAVRDPPRPAAGVLRPGAADDRQLLIGWWTAFETETERLHPPDAERSVAHALDDGSALIWELDGTPVALVGARPSPDGVATIGPVYTPPEHRRRGYAGTAVAAASRRLLADRHRTCMLFTDLANPTSNKIYAEVGYSRFADWDERRFTTTAGG